jgi:hypothetical protein
MVLSTFELVASLQSDVRILQHLIGKLDAASLDYRPTAGQRSARELVIYLSMMGPALTAYALADEPDIAIWVEAEQAAAGRTFEEAVAIIGTHGAQYAAMLADLSDETYRSEFTDFDGCRATRGAFLTNLVLTRAGMYRMQLFLYLKACGQALTSSDLWYGVEAPPT